MMREPDRVERKEQSRSISAIYEIGPVSETKTKLVTLTTIHSPHSKAFFSTIRVEEEEDWQYGKVRSFMLMEGIRVLAERVNRYSKKRLEEFHERALAEAQETGVLAQVIERAKIETGEVAA